jgi:hypothetical protein
MPCSSPTFSIQGRIARLFIERQTLPRTLEMPVNGSGMGCVGVLVVDSQGRVTGHMRPLPETDTHHVPFWSVLIV